MTKSNAVVCTIIFVCASCLAAARVYPDTIYTDDGREIKGIVVEDYKDRIVMSTVDGEVETLKSDIRQLYYDSEADNLIKLAEQSRERGDMIKAFAYYDMALRADPNSKAAKDGIVFLQGYLFRKEQVKKEDEIKKREEFEKFGAAKIQEERSPEEMVRDLSGDLRRAIGIALSEKDGYHFVESVYPGSPAAEAGVKKLDAMVAVWGRLTGYMSLEDMMKLLLEKPSLEIKCTVERDVLVRLEPGRNIISSLKEMSGASFVMLFDGLTVSEVVEDSPASYAGLAKGDLVVAINGKSTRYMPLKKAIAMMRGSRGGSIILKVRRELLIWRKV